jgi:hypothetical protein
VQVPAQRDLHGGGWFRIDNALIDGGELACLNSLVALKVYLVLRRFARNGEAWPSLATIAKLAGCNRGHVSRAIAILEGAGWISRAKRGRGPHQTTHYEMLDVASGATLDGPSGATTGGDAPSGAAQQPPGRGTNAPSGAAVMAPPAHGGATSGAAQQRPETKTSIKTNQKDQQQHEQAAVAGETGFGGAVAADLRSELVRAGIAPPALDRCCRVPGLAPVHVAVLAEECRRQGQGTGLLIQALEHRHVPGMTITPKHVAALGNAGRLLSIGGRRVNVIGRMVFNDGTNAPMVAWDDPDDGTVRVPAADLRPESIELKR